MSRAEQFKMIVDNLKNDLKVKRKQEELLIARKDDIEKKIEELNVDKLNQSLTLLQKLSESQRNKAKFRLEELGTKALQYSLGEEYEMRITIDSTRKRPQAYVKVYNSIRDVETNPYEDNGGGVIDIISVALRLVVLQAQQPAINGPVLVDEPFKMVSKEYIPMIVDFLKKISEDFGRQIIMISHNDYLAESCDKVISIGR